MMKISIKYLVLSILGGIIFFSYSIPPVLAADPTGYHDGASGTVSTSDCRAYGWAYDPDDLGYSIDVHVYRDGQAGAGGTLIGGYTTNDFRSDINSAFGLTGNHGFNITFDSLSGLRDGQNHTLYIYGINKEGTSGTNPLLNTTGWTINCPPPAPTTKAPSCLNPGTTATVAWDPAPNASYYQLRVDKSPDSWTGKCDTSAPEDFCNNNLLATSLSFSSTADATYGWWVHACGPNGNCSEAANGSDFWCQPPQPPSSPTNLTFSCLNPGTEATVDWADVSGATYYRLRVDKSPDSWNGLCDTSAPNDFCQNSLTSSSHVFSSTANATYGWWVEACNANGCSTQANGADFWCEPPPTPTNLTSSTSCSNNSYSANLSWTNTGTYVDITTDPNGNFNNSYYNKYVNGTSTTAPSGFNGALNVSGPLTLSPGTYFWRVYNGYTHSATSTFTVTSCAPAAPTIISGSCPNTTATLSWNDVSGEDYYNLRVDRVTGANPEWDGSCSSTAPNDFCSNYLLQNTTSLGFNGAVSGYRFWVDACNSYGCNSSISASFTCYGPPTANFTGSPPTSGLKDQPLSYSAKLTGGSQTGEIFIAVKDTNATTQVPNCPSTQTLNSQGQYWCNLGREGNTAVGGEWTVNYTPTQAGNYWVVINGYAYNIASSYDASNTCSGNPTATYHGGSLNFGTLDCGNNDYITVNVIGENAPPPYTSPSYPTPANITNCGPAATPRAQGLVTSPTVPFDIKFPVDSITGRCIIDNRAAFLPFKIPTYEDLKSLYFDQSKSTAKVEHTGSLGESGLSDDLNSGKTLIRVTEDLGMNGDITSGSNAAIVFIERNLNLASPMTQFTYPGGMVFVVKGDVNIDSSVTRIDAIIIAQGTIYTAGAGCSTSSQVTSPLTVNGSLISLDINRPTKFCRTLNDNNQPAEKIIQQPKYVVILRDLFSDTIQRWSEVP